jgi:hypothetical protein
MSPSFVAHGHSYATVQEGDSPEREIPLRFEVVIPHPSQCRPPTVALYDLDNDTPLCFQVCSRDISAAELIHRIAEAVGVIVPLSLAS